MLRLQNKCLKPKQNEAKLRRLPRESEKAETPQGAKRLRRLGARPQESEAFLLNVGKCKVVSTIYIEETRGENNV
ncbi:hypothetical protein CXF77_03420 [Planococcus sp. MB-3u-09]|nr:hypothetical protein CXF66_13865 [Planococcus sp. Urea-trap-24]PKG87258.1 hypothetical protein CXF91_14710 [Planococcus sp. Urea-3u-39]PKH42383.1 hypothetical protein CXF77_03420 [Planococcus sp. MB-3u-09]